MHKVNVLFAFSAICLKREGIVFHLFFFFAYIRTTIAKKTFWFLHA